MPATRQALRVLFTALLDTRRSLQQVHSQRGRLPPLSSLWLFRDRDHAGSNLPPHELCRLSLSRATGTVVDNSGAVGSVAKISAIGTPPLGSRLHTDKAFAKWLPEILLKDGGTRMVLSSEGEAEVAKVILRLREKLPDERVDAAADLPRVVAAFLSLRLTPEQVVSAFVKVPALLSSQLDEDLRPKFDQLLSHGVKESELAAAIRKHPMFLRSENMARVMHMLLNWGVRPERLGGTLVTSPCVFCLREENLTSKIDFLMGPSIGIVEVGPLMEKFPSLFTSSVQSMKAKCEYLKMVIPEVNFPKLLDSCPAVLGYTLANLEKKFVCLKKIFKHCDNVPRLIAGQPRLLTLNVASMETNLAEFQKLFGDEDTYRMINTHPLLVGLGWKHNIQPKLAFLFEVIALDKHEVVGYPAYLVYSLKNRIKPRTTALLAAGYRFTKMYPVDAIRPVNAKTVTLVAALHRSDQVFAKRFGLPYAQARLAVICPACHSEPALTCTEINSRKSTGGLRCTRNNG